MKNKRYAIMSGLLIWLWAAAGCQGAGSDAGMGTFETVREQLSAESPDSDAAVILSRALVEAADAVPEQQAAILNKALKEANEARRFTISEEAPLPDGWPKPSLPGLIRIKRYPAIRSAWVRAPEKENRQFMTLFRHIESRTISMTAPVIMEYAPEASQDAVKMDDIKAMAFLYRNPNQDQAGSFGSVQVENEEMMEVVSIGIRGAGTAGTFRKALGKLQIWLNDHPEWQASGPPRVLGYNSPFMWFWKKYCEVQIPVKPVEKKVNEVLPPLSAEEEQIIVHKGTERPFTGKYWKHFANGIYVCRRCGAELYTSQSKFRSECGWPSFDEEIPGAVRRQPDADGQRTEIICNACGAHLGHVFTGEGFTPRNVRHCVNSASLVFRSAPKEVRTEEAIFAGGCFWGVEHYFRQMPGVLRVTSGYTGGTVANPTYQQVCTGDTGHAEAVQVIFDPNQVSYENLAQLFFEIHDPTQRNRQGPDVGSQYRSAVFYRDADQKQAAESLVRDLKKRGYDVVTQIEPAGPFYPAEDYHQNYLNKHPERPSCHVRVPRFATSKP